MRRLKATLLLCFAGFLLIPAHADAQQLMPASIEGRVIDAQTGEPLRDAHVFLSGTKIGTITNPAGRFSISRIPPGSHRLVVSIIGYERDPEDILLRVGEHKTIYKELNPVVYEMDEIFAGDLDRRWRRHLNRFERLFLGETEMAESTEIVNPEVLRFRSRWWGRFTAEAMAPLLIENHALGYRITYHLDDFHHSGLRTRWTGDKHFEEMAPADSTQAVKWEENRQKTYEGSLRHFLLSLQKQEVAEEGYIVYHMRRDMHGNFHRNTFRVNPRQLIQDAEDDHFYIVSFPGRLEIVYTEQEEEPRYVRWSGDYGRARARVQTSYLQLNDRYVTVDPNGIIVEKYGATRFGYYSFKRVADKTPRDYRPPEEDEQHAEVR